MGQALKQELIMPTHYDAAIIGTGQAGPALANRLSQAGMKIAVIERKYFGGTCVNTGCMPTKTLVASAYAARLAARADEYGIELTAGFRVDMAKVKARKDNVVLTARKGIENWLASMPGCTVMHGHARFASSHEIEIGTERISADKTFINVGGRALVPPIPGLKDIDYFTNVSIMEADFVPQHLIVLGGSYIGLEFAQVYRRFGSEVTVVEAAPKLVPREDDDVSAAIKAILENEGIKVHVAAKCSGLARRGDTVVAQIETQTGSSEINGTHLLLAIGRKPNTDDLGLDAANVRVDQRGYISTDEYLCTSVPSIWALGDCNGRGAFTHTSYNDYEIVAANLLDGENRRVSDRILTYGLFIDPPLGRIGMTEAETRQSGRRTLIGTRPMSRVGRAVEKGETQGFMKILVDADTRKIVGAAILGTSGDEAIHCITDIMYAGAPYTTIQRAVHIHPTVSELIPTVLGELRPLT
jgi:pyruvate/2-oxoglutarate dehydrogenase complex dihydrolipoamide dehydrogenase (E3) component